MHGEGEERPDDWDREFGELAWLPGVDYIKGWSEATQAAEALGDCLVELGFPADDVRVSGRTGHEGQGSVKITVSVPVARGLTLVLARGGREPLHRRKDLGDAERDAPADD